MFKNHLKITVDEIVQDVVTKYKSHDLYTKNVQNKEGLTESFKRKISSNHLKKIKKSRNRN